MSLGDKGMQMANVNRPVAAVSDEDPEVKRVAEEERKKAAQTGGRKGSYVSNPLFAGQLKPNTGD